MPTKKKNDKQAKIVSQFIEIMKFLTALIELILVFKK